MLEICFKARFFMETSDCREIWRGRGRWYGEDSLEEAFPSLYSLASSRDAWVAQLWDESGELGHWNLVFTRLNND
ncbi:hypothetical protein CK203_002911 [Vitis vinifera]|uniref:Uncharacterized protein n=1 Tax=Vitis vinifera TaxID=29760 RepID=A0A438KH02_VITVI|nr:hypothetical protein CK203_002911 [Vitis vinifera]